MNFFPKYKLSLISLIFGTSLIYNLHIFQYESTLSKIWQFMTGIAAQSYAIQEKNQIKLRRYFVLCLFVVFLPFEFNSFITSSIAVLRSSSNGADSPFKGILEVKTFGEPLVFLGDISYILYLTHWPVVVYSRFTMLGDDFGLFCKSLFL